MDYDNIIDKYLSGEKKAFETDMFMMSAPDRKSFLLYLLWLNKQNFNEKIYELSLEVVNKYLHLN
jgi:hypothetical protein